MTAALFVSFHDRAEIASLLLSRTEPSPVYAALTNRLNDATVVPAPDMPSNVVRLNSRVRLAWLDAERGAAEQSVVRLVAPGEMKDGHLSVLTPTGAALLGRHAGETLTVVTPRGPARVRVESVQSDPVARETAKPVATPVGVLVVALIFALAATLG